MEDKPWVKYITEENLPNEDMKIIAAIIGLAPTVKLMCEIPGTNISIPKNATLFARTAYIRDVYDGSKKSRIQLSKICNLSENYILRNYREKQQ